ncbi:MAG: hypothetical protein HY706_17685 [Candidatus Hydrogenedentes bacterium]|nr:hypothetical protein [Candidatus Hydrogenedentota bacterium]
MRFRWPFVRVALRLLVDRTCLVIYADDRVALSTRMYDHWDGNLGCLVVEGVSQFRSLTDRR